MMCSKKHDHSCDDNRNCKICKNGTRNKIDLKTLKISGTIGFLITLFVIGYYLFEYVNDSDLIETATYTIPKQLDDTTHNVEEITKTTETTIQKTIDDNSEHVKINPFTVTVNSIKEIPEQLQGFLSPNDTPKN